MLRSRILGLALIALAATSCAAPADDLVADPPPTTPAPYTPAPSKMLDPKILTNPLEDPNANLRITYSSNFFSDPIPDPVPKVPVSKEDAEALAARDQFFDDETQPGSPITALRLVSLGSLDEPRQPHLAWVLTWKDSKAVVRGGVNISAEEKEKIAANTQCVFVVVVNAITGEAEEVRQSCRSI